MAGHSIMNFVGYDYKKEHKLLEDEIDFALDPAMKEGSLWLRSPLRSCW